MDLVVIGKGEKFELEVVSKREAPTEFYFGAGWDNPNGPVDLDIVCVLLVGGKLTKQEHFVYFSNRNAPGVALSEDNTTGDGDGDDEDIVINTANLPADVDKVVIGLVSYAGPDLSSAPNPHFRVCDGNNEKSEQMGDVKISGTAPAGSTALVAFELTKGGNGWELSNVESFHALGQGTDVIKGFSKLFS